MRLFNIPYKWTRRPFENISHAYWDIRNGLRNLVYFFPAVWMFVRWDDCGLLLLMETALRDMVKAHEPGHLDRAPRTAKQLRVCAELCKRLREDNYFDNAGYVSETWDATPQSERHFMAMRAASMPKEDARYLGLLIGKYINSWWD